MGRKQKKEEMGIGQLKNEWEKGKATMKEGILGRRVNNLAKFLNELGRAKMNKKAAPIRLAKPKQMFVPPSNLNELRWPFPPLHFLPSIHSVLCPPLKFCWTREKQLFRSRASPSPLCARPGSAMCCGVCGRENGQK